MPLPARSPTLASFRKQNLLVEFAGLRSAHLDGVYVSITPGDATLWAGVLFVRRGPYAPAVLRFHVSFPAAFPAHAPLVTFSTDVFHPLLTPLTTYTYTAAASESDTVSATDERLPPGGFSLRHGFPHWFGRAPPEHVSVAAVLDYVRSTFTDDALLDAIPLHAAANPGAHHAWRTHRAHALPAPRSPPDEPASAARPAEGSARGRPRGPGEWNWEGVWEERVRKAVQESLSEPALFAGGAVGDDLIRFQDVDDDTLAQMKHQLEAASSRAAAAG